MSDEKLTCEEIGKNPRVWLKIPGYVIRNFSPDLEESVVQHMMSSFLKEEPVFSSCDFENDPVSMRELDVFCRKILTQNIALIAIPEGDPGADLKPVTGVIPLAGVNMLMFSRKNDPPRNIEEMFSGAAIRKALNTFKYAIKDINFHVHFVVDELIEAAGLAVHVSHRGRGLGAALLEARIHLCKALGVKATRTTFTSVPAQKIGLRSGYTTFRTIKYGDMKDDQDQRKFPNLPPDNYILVTARTV